MEIIKHTDNWTFGTRVLLLRGRHKDGLERQRSIVRTTNGAKSFRRALDELQKLSVEGERIYSSASSRDMNKAIRIFKERQLAADYDGDTLSFYRKMEARWVSCLMNPKAQDNRVWLFDCDSKRELYHALSELEKHYDRPIKPYIYPTKNGWHILVSPFNKSLVSEEAQKLIQINPQMLWGF